MNKSFHFQVSIFLLVFLIIHSGCTDKSNNPSFTDQNHSQYNQALALWSSRQIHNYVMRQRLSMWGPVVIDDTMNIYVNADTITIITFPSGLELDSIYWGRYKSISQLFYSISRDLELDTLAFTVTVEYDPLLGYPANFVMYSNPPVGPTDIGYGISLAVFRSSD